MSKNKIRQTEHVSKSIPVIKPLIYILLIVGFIWGLYALFQPSGDLVPYNEYKKTDVSIDKPEEVASKNTSKSLHPPVN